jgi:hypothetical protein
MFASCLNNCRRVAVQQFRPKQKQVAERKLPDQSLRLGVTDHNTEFVISERRVSVGDPKRIAKCACSEENIGAFSQHDQIITNSLPELRRARHRQRVPWNVPIDNISEFLNALHRFRARRHEGLKAMIAPILFDLFFAHDWESTIDAASHEKRRTSLPSDALECVSPLLDTSKRILWVSSVEEDYRKRSSSQEQLVNEVIVRLAGKIPQKRLLRYVARASVDCRNPEVPYPHPMCRFLWRERLAGESSD